MVPLQHLQDDFALQFVHALARELLQRNWPVERDVGIEKVWFACHQVVGDHFFMAQNHVAFDQVFQLPNVSRPVILLQDCNYFVRQRPCPAVELLVVVFEEVGAQIFNVATPFAQRRHVQIHHVDAVIEILAEGPGFDFRLQVAVGRAHHSHLDLLVFLGADAAELAILQELQQLRLQEWVKLGDFI